MDRITPRQTAETERLHAEAVALVADPDDMAEARAVLADMEAFRA